jgi:hypothetical protein
LVTGKSKPRRVGVDFHCSSQSLLRAGSHAVCFVEDDKFVSAGRESDFLLRKSLDAISYNIDTCIYQQGYSSLEDNVELTSLVTSIQFQNSFLIRLPQELACETEDTGRLSNTGHTRDDYMWHVALLGNDFKSLNRLGVANDIVKKDWPVFLDPTKTSVKV